MFERLVLEDPRNLGAIFTGSHLGIAIVTPEGTVLASNPALSAMLGYTAAELRDLSLSQIYRAEHREQELQLLGELLAGERPSYQVEHRSVHQAGHDIWLSVHVTPLRDDLGRIARLMTSCENLTERKQAEAARVESEARYRTCVDHAPAGVFITDRHGRVLDVNPAASEITGYSRTELLSMSTANLGSPGSEGAVDQLLERLERRDGRFPELAIVRKDGTRGRATVNAAALGDGTYLAFVSDVTETRRLQQLETRAQSLELAGTIAAQVAHDFNNLLSPMMAYPQCIRESLDDPQEVLALVDDIEKAARRISDINQDLLAMGRHGHCAPSVLRLNEIVTSAAEDIRSRCPSLVVDLQLSPDLLGILGGSVQLHRVLANLLSNARDATQGRGTVTVQTDNWCADDTSVEFTRIPFGEYVRLTVSDDGCGIADADLHRVFEPFFTSKEADNKSGAGLGLTVVDAVVKDHGGYVDLKSVVGDGTSIRIYLPLIRVAASTEPAAYAPKGAEKVLVVDDDEIHRAVSRRLLASLGYQVSAVESGSKAIEHVANESQDLLILDMVMPGGPNGADTYRKVKEIRPNQRAIIVSGYAESARVREAQELGAGDFVCKPLTKTRLAAAVRKELDRE